MKMKWSDYLEKRQNKIYPAFLGLGYRIECDYRNRSKGAIVPPILKDNRKEIYNTMIKICADAYEYQNVDNLQDLKALVFTKNELDSDLISYLRGQCIEEIETINLALKNGDNSISTKDTVLLDRKYSVETVLKFMLERILVKITAKYSGENLDNKVKNLNLSDVEKSLIIDEAKMQDDNGLSGASTMYRKIANILEKSSEIAE